MKGNISAFVGSKIKEIRKKRKLTQKELGLKVGVKHNTISSYENGTNDPEQDMLYKISKVLDVSINEFFPSRNEDVVTESKALYNVSNSFDYNFFPTAISAGLPFEVDGMTESEKISVPNSLMGRWARDEDVYLTKIYGDSMDKVMRDGSIIAIKPIPKEGLKDGDIVVFSDSYEYSVKHYYKHDDKLVFRPNSNNASHHEQHYKTTDNIEIHGKVVMWIVTTD